MKTTFRAMLYGIAAAAFALAPKAYAFHSGGVAECEGCHTMHNTRGSGRAIPLAGGVGQEHAVAVQETLYELRELVEPPIRTSCWLSNISAGAPKELRPSINNTFLAMLSGLGLWSASLDVLNKETMRTVRLIRAINNKKSDRSHVVL